MAGVRIMKIEITVPLKFADEVVHDLKGRGGSLLDRRQASTTVVISALVPLDAMSDYAVALRTMSDGHGTFRMAFDHYETAPSRR